MTPFLSQLLVDTHNPHAEVPHSSCGLEVSVGPVLFDNQCFEARKGSRLSMRKV
jgi:hypothetical protein